MSSCPAASSPAAMRAASELRTGGASAALLDPEGASVVVLGSGRRGAAANLGGEAGTGTRTMGARTTLASLRRLALVAERWVMSSRGVVGWRNRHCSRVHCPRRKSRHTSVEGWAMFGPPPRKGGFVGRAGRCTSRHPERCCPTNGNDNVCFRPQLRVQLVSAEA